MASSAVGRLGLGFSKPLPLQGLCPRLCSGTSSGDATPPHPDPPPPPSLLSILAPSPAPCPSKSLHVDGLLHIYRKVRQDAVRQ